MAFPKKAQSSFEFLLTFGIGFALIVILGGLFITYSGGAKESLDRKQVETIGQEIIFNIEKIFFLGAGNRLSISTTFPSGIENFTIHHTNNSGEEFDYLNITYINNGNYVSDIFTTKELYTRFNCTQCFPGTNVNWYNVSDYSEGAKTIRVTSKGEYVSIDFVKE